MPTKRYSFQSSLRGDIKKNRSLRHRAQARRPINHCTFSRGKLFTHLQNILNITNRHGDTTIYIIISFKAVPVNILLVKAVAECNERNFFHKSTTSHSVVKKHKQANSYLLTFITVVVCACCLFA